MRIDPVYWSPARMNFAAFKLFAWALLRGRPRVLQRTDVDRVVVQLEPGRNGFEAVSLAVVHTMLSFVAIFAFLERFIRARPITFALLSPLIIFGALVATQTAMFLICLAVSRVRRATGRLDSPRWNSLAVTAATIVLALWLIDRGGWSRWPGALWLGMLALNILASGVLFLMRERIRIMEMEIERGVSSAA